MVLVKKELYAFKFYSPVSAYKIVDITEHLVKTTLFTHLIKKQLERFAVSYFASSIVQTTGDDR